MFPLCDLRLLCSFDCRFSLGVVGRHTGNKKAEVKPVVLGPEDVVIC